MSSSPTSAQLIAAVQRSPQLVAVHDRFNWCGLYAGDGEVNDPVGSRPHRGREAIERFYDTFIAPNKIVFRVEKDVVCGMTVMRDLTVQTGMSGGVTLNVPMHLRYDLIEEGGGLKIRCLSAHWELPFMILELLKTGFKGVLISFQLGPRLIRHQGIGGMLGFMQGFLGSGRGGKATARRFLTALQRGDTNGVGACLDHRAELEMPAYRSTTPQEMTERLRGLQWTKMIAAGNSVTASVQIGGYRGVALLHFDHGSKKISGVQLYL